MKQIKQDNRLESIKKVHSKTDLKFTTRMEDYLEIISELIELKGYAIPSDISNYMNVKPSSVTKMLRRLDQKGYINYTKYLGLKLNPKGERLSKEIRQKHSDLLEFFVMIGVNPSIANKDVEGMEHHLADKTMKQFRKFISFLKSKPELLSLFKQQNN